jgi:NAD-dependent DNA ligase
MNNVIEKLRELDKRYYREGNSPVSDEKYDAIKEKAKKLYPDHPYFNKVGYPAKNEKVGLPYVIGSLNKVKIDSIEDWLKKIDGPIFCTEKLDSISLYVEYIDGELSFAAKRGDGFYGEDITEKDKVFCPKIDNM